MAKQTNASEGKDSPIVEAFAIAKLALWAADIKTARKLLSVASGYEVREGESSVVAEEVSESARRMLRKLERRKSEYLKLRGAVRFGGELQDAASEDDGGIESKNGNIRGMLHFEGSGLVLKGYVRSVVFADSFYANVRDRFREGNKVGEYIQIFQSFFDVDGQASEEGDEESVGYSRGGEWSAVLRSEEWPRRAFLRIVVSDFHTITVKAYPGYVPFDLLDELDEEEFDDFFYVPPSSYVKEWYESLSSAIRGLLNVIDP